MQVHMHESDISVRYLKHSELTMSRVECSLDRHRISDHSECLAVEGRIPLGASTVFIICSRSPAIGLYASSVIVDLF